MFIIKYLLLTIFSLRLSYARPVIDSESFFSNAAYISSPSIYSYTIENQLPYKQQNFTQQQHPYATAAANYRNGAAYKSTNDFNNSNNNNFNNFNRDLKEVNDYPTMTASALGTTTTNPNGLLSTQSAPISDCTLDRLAVYKVVLHTYWTRELFPKHYPDWRPTAQWTKTIGRTHDTLYALYHIGQQATSGIKQFAETGKSDVLDSALGEQQQQQQHASNIKFSEYKTTSDFSLSSTAAAASIERSIFDEFNLPPIVTGAGRSEAKFFVDSNHSLVSLMTRIVPSPDWFIGVDSFQLCVGGSWIDTVTIEMDPLDAGTDNGFTFTAPNWPTSPQGVIYRVTSRYPAHPAGSFFYPKSKRLPPIATFQFIKLKEYELSEVFNFAEDDRKYETVQTQTHLEMEHNHVEMNNELSATIERERQNEITPQPTHVTEKDRIRSQLLAKMNPMNNSTVQMALGVVPKNDKQAIMQSIANSYRRASQTKPTNLGGTVNKKIVKHRRTKRTRDCRVSHWSEWSDCSKSCGIGEMHRYRQVIKHGKRGGRPCPPLKQSKLCGSEQGCHAADNYFNWSDS